MLGGDRAGDGGGGVERLVTTGDHLLNGRSPPPTGRWPASTSSLLASAGVAGGAATGAPRTASTSPGRSPFTRVCAEAKPREVVHV